MPSFVKKLCERQIIKQLPSFIPENTHYECIMGSLAYGVSSDSSDYDMYGFCVPPKEIVFPHTAGEILGFGRQKQRFEVWQQHHLFDQSARGGKGQNYDISIYSIVKYFNLLMENNPNMVDSLFVPERCVLFSSPIGAKVRLERHLFLHKGGFHKFMGYAYSMMHKMKSKNPGPDSKRRKLIQDFGYDTKYAYNLVRLLLEEQQILEEGDLDLERSREILKSIRRGEWKEEDIYKFYAENETMLKKAYENSKLRHSPNEEKIKALLIDCLEMHFQSLDGCVEKVDKDKVILDQIAELLKQSGR